MSERINSLLAAAIVILVTVCIVLALDVYAPYFAQVVEFNQILTVLVRSLIIFLFAFMMLRLLGKRQLTQLTFIDLLIIIAFGSAIGDVMIYSEDIVHLISSVAAVGFITLIVIVINSIIARNAAVGRLISGRSAVILRNGKVLHEALAKESMNEEELKEELREKGIHSYSNLREVILEPNGGLSIKRKRKNHSK